MATSLNQLPGVMGRSEAEFLYFTQLLGITLGSLCARLGLDASFIPMEKTFPR